MNREPDRREQQRNEERSSVWISEQDDQKDYEERDRRRLRPQVDPERCACPGDRTKEKRCSHARPVSRIEEQSNGASSDQKREQYGEPRMSEQLIGRVQNRLEQPFEVDPCSVIAGEGERVSLRKSSMLDDPLARGEMPEVVVVLDRLERTDRDQQAEQTGCPRLSRSGRGPHEL